MWDFLVLLTLSIGNEKEETIARKPDTSVEQRVRAVLSLVRREEFFPFELRTRTPITTAYHQNHQFFVLRHAACFFPPCFIFLRIEPMMTLKLSVRLSGKFDNERKHAWKNLQRTFVIHTLSYSFEVAHAQYQTSPRRLGRWGRAFASAGCGRSLSSWETGRFKPVTPQQHGFHIQAGT